MAKKICKAIRSGSINVDGETLIFERGKSVTHIAELLSEKILNSMFGADGPWIDVTQKIGDETAKAIATAEKIKAQREVNAARVKAKAAKGS